VLQARGTEIPGPPAPGSGTSSPLTNLPTELRHLILEYTDLITP
jgi:hypothetical protein